MYIRCVSHSRDLGPVKCLDAAKCDAEGVPLDQRHPDVAVVEEPRLVLQDVLRQQLSQLQERTEEGIRESWSILPAAY